MELSENKKIIKLKLILMNPTQGSVCIKLSTRSILFNQISLRNQM